MDGLCAVIDGCDRRVWKKTPLLTRQTRELLLIHPVKNQGIPRDLYRTYFKRAASRGQQLVEL